MRKVSRQEQLEQWRWRYERRKAEGKSRILDELCEQYRYHRKHAIRLMNGPRGSPRKRPRPGPERPYQSIASVLQAIWRAAEQPCGKRLVQVLPLWLPHYEKRYGALLPSQRRLVQAISAASADRWLEPARAHAPGRGLGGTKPGSLLRRQIPIQGEVWDEKRAGFLEADSVAHCGGSLAGSFIWSLT
jgi:hypothetical protein